VESFPALEFSKLQLVLHVRQRLPGDNIKWAPRLIGLLLVLVPERQDGLSLVSDLLLASHLIIGSLEDPYTPMSDTSDKVNSLQHLIQCPKSKVEIS
jgi:hypothetical protein